MKRERVVSMTIVVLVLIASSVCPAEAEILQVPAYGPGYGGPPSVTSTTILTANEWYIFEVSGIFTYDSIDSPADAEWFHDLTWGDPIDWDEDFPGDSSVLDLLINDTPQDWMGTTDLVITDNSVFSAHTYSPTHVYRLEWMGTGEAVTFRIEDGPSHDNEGFLEVEISVAEPACGFSEDFDNYTTGFLPRPPWQYSIQPGVTIEIDDNFYISGKSLHFLDPTSSAQGTMWRNFAQTSYVVLEYYMMSRNVNYEGTFLQLRGDGGDDYCVSFGNQGGGGHTGYIGVFGSSGGWIEPELMPYDVNTWYYVRRVLNCNTNTGYFYVEEVGNPNNNASYNVGSNYVNTYIDEIFTWTSGSQGADCYIDEITIGCEPTGPVAYWSFDDVGNPGHDDSGNGNNGTVYGAVSADGICGEALSFDGTNDYVEVSSSSGLEVSGDEITIAAWVKPGTIVNPTGSQDYMTITRKMLQTGDSGGYLLRLAEDAEGKATQLNLGLKTTGLGFVELYDTSHPVPIGQWSHVAGVYDGSSMKLFLNGELIASRSLSGSIIATSTPLVLGKLAYNYNSEYFHGPIDEVRIYDRALTASEIEDLYTSCPEPAAIFVDRDATGANNGSNWVDAFNHLQDALAVAECGDEIRVAEDIYRPDEDTCNPDGTGDRSATFQLINGVALYGGFPSGGSNWEDRDPEAYETILSGDLLGNDGPGEWENNGENSYHVVTGSGTNNTALLDGFTITAGNANSGSWPDDFGGGMFNNSSSPTVTNCTFTGNSAGDTGGGMCNWENCSPTLVNCTFTGNYSVAGGGMFNYYSSPMVTNCAFNANSAIGYGGGMGNYYSSPTVINCVFSGNSSREAGGMNGDSGNPTVVNCTFSGNSATYRGGGLHNYSCSPEVTNCIFWGNTAPTGPQIYEMAGSSANVTYSDVQGGWPGEGNINADPCYVDPANGDYHLLPDSPCIDAGDNNAVPPEITTDLDGNPRIVNGIVDMGAYEFQNKPPVADAGGPYIAQATSWSGTEVQLDGTGSADPDGDTLTYEWDLDLLSDADGDGNPTNDVDSTEPILSWTFPIDQTEISLVVIDECGRRSEPDITAVTVSIIGVTIDIKPSSVPNSINLGSGGVVPIAFLTDPDFDASTIDPATVTLRGEDFAGLVKLRGKKDAPVPMANLEDVDGDGDLDLVVHLDTESLAERELTANCEVGALTYDGYVVSGTDTINIVSE